MNDNHDDWMNNPLETDDFINTLEEETKGVQRRPGGGCSFDGCVYIVVVGGLILFAIIFVIASITSSCVG